MSNIILIRIMVNNHDQNYYKNMDKDPTIEQPINHKGHLHDIELWSENSEYNYKTNVEITREFLLFHQSVRDLRYTLLDFIKSVLDEIENTTNTKYLFNNKPNDYLEKLTFRCLTNVFIKNVLYEALEQIQYDQRFKRYSKNRITKLIDKLEIDQSKHVALLEKLQGE